MRIISGYVDDELVDEVISLVTRADRNVSWFVREACRFTLENVSTFLTSRHIDIPSGANGDEEGGDAPT